MTKTFGKSFTLILDQGLHPSEGRFKITSAIKSSEIIITYVQH